MGGGSGEGCNPLTRGANVAALQSATTTITIRPLLGHLPEEPTGPIALQLLHSSRLELTCAVASKERNLAAVKGIRSGTKLRLADDLQSWNSTSDLGVPSELHRIHKLTMRPGQLLASAATTAHQHAPITLLRHLLRASSR